MPTHACEKLKKSQLPKVWAEAFPAYKGRKFRLEVRRQMHGLQGYWDGGTRSEFKAIHLLTGEVHEASNALRNPYNREPHATLDLRPNFVLVEHQIFCGEDQGICFHVHPEAFSVLNGLNRPEQGIAALVATAGV